MKAEDFLSDDFLKQFKTGEQLNEFLASIQNRKLSGCFKSPIARQGMMQILRLDMHSWKS
ncbi:hypothetical protein [Niabella sp.]|uniref:hypothetical protein n=1 Tax=Niabella sp. TaxID=1962976 RepID=UPI0026181649|nr:hypothetical protein [Niabella sp.]